MALGTHPAGRPSSPAHRSTSHGATPCSFTSQRPLLLHGCQQFPWPTPLLGQPPWTPPATAANGRAPLEQALSSQGATPCSSMGSTLPAPSLFPLDEHKCRPTTSLSLLFLRPIYFPWTAVGAMPPRPLSSPLPHKTAAAASRRRPRRAAARPPLPPMTPCNLPPSSLCSSPCFSA
jgi:hypothetical protein